MKPWALFFGIIVILAVFCSPVLAISKSDLISQYKTGDFRTPVPTQPPRGMVVPVEPRPTPYLPSWYEPVINPGHNPDGSEAYLPIPSSDTLPAPKWAFPIIPDSYAKNKSSYFHSLIDYLHWYDDDIPVGKPNIYLYSDRDLTARVRLAPENAITISEPVYQPGKGWTAVIWNGSLNGAGDFLFYEALVPDSVWQKNEGYVIRAEYRGEDMASMLGQYNFNEKESVEFIEYWSQHLAEGVDYVFYPQEAGAVDKVMPLSISPEPDHVMRIWFYAEPPVSIPEPVKNPEKIIREGFYVVEWGVMIR